MPCLQEFLPSVAFVLLLTALFYVKRNRKYRRLPPGPKGLPILGYLPFKGKRPAKTYFDLSIKYGPVISMNMAISRVVVLNDYDSIHEALVKNGNVFSGRPTLVAVADSGNGLGIATRNFDDNFKRLRKFVLTSMRSFGFGKKSMEEKINEEIRCFMELLRSKNGKSFNEHTDFAKSVSNVLSNITLGRRFPYDDQVFRKMVDLINDSFSDPILVLSLSLVNTLPALRHFPIISRYYSRFRGDLVYIRDFLRKSIDEHKSGFDPEQSRDFIDEFIKETRKVGKDDPCFNADGFCENVTNITIVKSGNQLVIRGAANSEYYLGYLFKSVPEDQLTYVLHDLLVAGTETTSSTLRWCMLLFAHRPDIQAKISDEINQIIGESQPTMKHREEMPYTQAVLHEITRHRTLAQLSIPHATTADTEFRGYFIPKDTMVLPNIWAVHHDRRNFDDPDEFRPERFIEQQTGNFVPNKKVIPFSIGPRYCLGEQLAKMELFLFLTNIVQNFQISPDLDKPLPDFNNGVIGDAEVPKEYEIRYLLR